MVAAGTESAAGASKKKATKASGAGTQSKAKKPRKKKTSTTRPSAANTKELMNDAKLAAQDLALQRSQAAARKADPLWYKAEEVAEIVKGQTMMAPDSALLPEQQQIVEAALSHHGLNCSNVTPQALACLFEQARRFAQEIILDAQDYASMANRSELTKADLTLASDLRADNPTSAATLRQLPKLNMVAQQMNRVPLPPIPSHCYSGVVLPTKSQQLTARTYDLVSASHIKQRAVQNVPAAPSENSASYGVTKGRQIPIKLKESATASSSNATGGPAPMDTGTPPKTPKTGASATTPQGPTTAS